MLFLCNCALTVGSGVLHAQCCVSQSRSRKPGTICRRGGGLRAVAARSHTAGEDAVLVREMRRKREDNASESCHTRAMHRFKKYDKFRQRCHIDTIDTGTCLVFVRIHPLDSFASTELQSRPKNPGKEAGRGRPALAMQKHLLDIKWHHESMGNSSVWAGSLLWLHRILHATRFNLQYLALSRQKARRGLNGSWQTRVDGCGQQHTERYAGRPSAPISSFGRSRETKRIDVPSSSGTVVL